MPGSAPSPFSYAILRVVPRVDRGERLNAGVVVFCRQRDYLAAAVALDRARLAVLDPEAPAAELEDRLRTLQRVAAGDPRCGALAELPPSERFGWLAAPASTIVQPSEVHTGLTNDPDATLRELFTQLVSLPPPAAGA
jgi:hypothetical protein